MHIPTVSTISKPCSDIIIQSIGESTYDGWYERFIFGTYHFLSIDARGNNIYYANIQGWDMFIAKDAHNDWLVDIGFNKDLNYDVNILRNTYFKINLCGYLY